MLGLSVHDHDTLMAAVEALQCSTGLTARVLDKEPCSTLQGGADAEIEIMVGQQALRFAVEIKRVDRFAVLVLVKQQMSQWELPGLLVAPRITPEIGEQCRALSLSFIDMAGNAFLQAAGVFVLVSGRRPPLEKTVGVASRRAGTAASLKVIFALLCRPELWGASYREIGQMAGVSLGAIGGVFEDLAVRGMIVGGTRGSKRRLLEPRRLLDEWVVNYPIKLRPKLNVRRFRASDPLWWQGLDVTRYGARWGGEVAAEKLTRFLKPGTCTLYIQADREGQNRKRLILENKLRADPNGDIALLDAFWGFPDSPSFPDIAPLLLVYADLLETQDPRSHETAQIIRERYLDHTVSSA